MDETKIKAVEMVRAIRDRMYEDTKHMSLDEYIAYIEQRASHLEQRTATAHPSEANRPAA